MLPDFSSARTWLTAHPETLQGMQHGVEREALRLNRNGFLAITPHPQALGSPLTHRWITTDFSEAMLEFISPPERCLTQLNNFLYDIHYYTLRHLEDEQLWPFSMPFWKGEGTAVPIAQYGCSNLGRFKTLYRHGLQHRYGVLTQCITGIHYNISFPPLFWKMHPHNQGTDGDIERISAGYFALIRNYHRYGWIIPYLFGASPVLSGHFLKSYKTTLPFEPLTEDACALPYATSLRMSELGYINQRGCQISIDYNHLKRYAAGLKYMTRTPSHRFSALGLKKDGLYLQLNNHILQIENELYAPIRPKQSLQGDEKLSDALLQSGVGYVEIRALDINPWSPVGVSLDQLYFIDLFLIWCALVDSPRMGRREWYCCQENWNRVALAGRQPQQYILLPGNKKQTISAIGTALLADLAEIAASLYHYDPNYSTVCPSFAPAVADPSKTFSAQVIDALYRKKNLYQLGTTLAKQHQACLYQHILCYFNEEHLVKEWKRSLMQQQQLEQADQLPFSHFLHHYLQ